VGVFGFATNLTQLSGNGQSGILVWALKAARRRITLAIRPHDHGASNALRQSRPACGRERWSTRLGAAKGCAQSPANGFAPD